jgi:hypothetical protein
MKHVTRTFIAASIMVTGLWFAPVAANAATSVPRPGFAHQPILHPGSAHTAPTPRPFIASEKPRPFGASEKPRPFGASSKPRPIHANKAAEHCAPKKAC